MHDLTAQVTSSLLPFSGATVDALGEDEITLDSVLQGKFSVGRSGLAWLACGPHLEVVHAVTGERLSAYRFSGGGEHPPRVLAARDFSWLKRSGLLVGLEEAEGSVLCLYDLGLSRVVKAVVIPGRITAIEPIVSYGGASTSTQHLHQSLRWFFGIAAVVTDLGHVLLVDLCLDDLSCSQSEQEASDLQVVTKSPAEIPRLREVSTRQGRHLCLQLNGPAGVGVTALQYIPRTNQLAVGFSDGYLQLWNMKVLKKEYHSQLEGGQVPVHAFTFQEPENDPRNCCYLWAVQSSQDLEGDTVSLHLLQLAFSDRKCLASGKILYEGLEYCEERYSQEISGTTFPLRAQTTNTRLLSCQTIEKFRHHPDRDDSMNEVASPDTSVSMFSWQVKAYGQGTPSTFIGVFDINRWYHAQMPDSLRTGESLQNCPYLAVWSLDLVVQMVSPHCLIDVVVHERSLSRGLPFTCPPPEQYFNPTTYNFDATCLLNSGIVHLTCSGYQKETLSFLKKAAPCSSDIISTSYSHCLMSGLLSSRLADTQASNLSQEEQLDAILSTAVETSSLGLITGCIKQWTAEEQPGSALNLRYILDWAWNKVVQTKEELDGICAPLFDSSSNFTDPQTLQMLQHSQRLLSNLSAIFHCLLSEAQELTQKGLAGLMNKNMVSSLISKYAQVVLWFCRTGLLPEGSDEDAMQISRPFYTHSVISNYYTIRKEELTRLAKSKWCADCLMIDGLVGQCGERLTNLWKRDEGGTGQYPPPTLHALLDIYLLDNIDEASKHAIVIYLLLDVMYSFPNKDGASVESFPTAFAIPIGLVKLVQGLWLLDHHDHQSSFELLLHPAASQFHFEWQHERILQALMCQGQQPVALRYFHVSKPPISSTSQAKLCISVLLHNRCLIEAWCLLRQHSNRLNMAELLGFLYESCQELGLVKELLKLPLGLNEQECLEKFLQGTGGLQNRELLMVHYLQQAKYIPALQLNQSLKMNLVNERDPKLKERSNTRNSILEKYGKVLPRVQRKLAMERAKPYQHPYTIHREVSRPQPLSTITKRSANEKVMSRAGFINNVLTKIEEVWLGKEATPQSSPAKSTRMADAQTPSPKSSFPDPFLGTPITMTSRRKSRLMDLVVHPSCQTPRPLLSPTRPPSSWISPKSFSKVPELSLLQTPQVVKRARALAASGPVFSGFTPQSILRSSLRPTPVATPSASPGRSITPPLRSKESRITFIEEAEPPETEKGIRWTNGMAADSEISLLTKGSTLSKANRNNWSPQPAEENKDRNEDGEQPCVKFLPPEGGIPSAQLKCSESESSSTHEVAEETSPPDTTQAPLSPNLDTSEVSVRSTETTLEYYDAPLSEDHREGHGLTPAEEDDDVVTVNIKPFIQKEDLEEKSEETTEQSLNLTSEDSEKEDDGPFENTMASGITQEARNEQDLESKREDEPIIESDDKQEYISVLDQVDPSALQETAGNGTTESSDFEVKPENLPVKDDGLDVQSEAVESMEPSTEQTKPSEGTETTNEPAEDLEQSSDLTEFVQQHLFGGDLSPLLTRSAIHNAHIQTSLNSEALGEKEEEEEAATEAPQAFTTQKSSTSVTSSEPTGTDSHSVVSVNDSEELSSPTSEEEDDDEEEEEEESSDQAEEEEEEEEEDSGSEVEIIDEVKGNGRLPPLQPSSAFLQQGHTHFLPALSEQEAAAFSLISPGAEIKMVEDDMEGEVVMVRLGTEDGGMGLDEDAEQESSYMELKPSTTLLVPLELVEGQHSLADGAQLCLPELQQAVTSDLQSEDPHGFSLMLDLDEDGLRKAHTLPDENNLQLPAPSLQSQVVDVSEEFLAKADIIPLSTDDQNTSLSGEALQEDERKEMESLDENIDRSKKEELAKLETDLQTEYTAAEQETEDATEQKDAELETLPDEHESAALSVSVLTSAGELPPAQKDDNSVAKKEIVDEEMRKKEKPEEQELPQEQVGPEELEELEKQQKPEELQEIEEQQKPQELQKSEELQEPEELEKPEELQKLEQQKPEELQELKEQQRFEDLQEHEELEKSEELQELEKPEELQEPKEVEKPEDLQELEKPEELQVPGKPQKPEEKISVAINPEIALSEEMEPAVETEQQDLRESEKTEAKSEEATEETARQEDDEEKPVEQALCSHSQSAKHPVPQTPTSQRKKAPSTPTRRMTRGRTVKFISLTAEADDEPDVGGIADTQGTLAGASPSRTSRNSKGVKDTKVQTSTPKRNTRRTHPDLPKDEVEEVEAMENDTSVASISKASSPARRSRASATRSSQRHHSDSGETFTAALIEIRDKEEQEDGVVEPKTGRQRASKTPTLSKSRTTQVTTARRSSRKMKSSTVEPTPLEMVSEEKEQDESPVHPVKQSTRKTKTVLSEPIPALLEEEEDIKTQISIPVRTTRQSSQITLNLYPQSTRKIRREEITENVKENEALLKSELNRKADQTSSRRSTRQSRLWDHPEEDLPLLDSPLEVDSETPVADALIKRLKDEEEKQEGGVATKMEKTIKSHTKSSVQPASSPPPVTDAVVPEHKEDESSPGEHSFIYSPSRRRRTRAHREESPGPSEEFEAPVTRSRSRVKSDPRDKISSEEDHVDVEKAAAVSKTRKTGKQTAKSKAVSEPLPIAEVDVISPPPSPANPLPRALMRIKDGEAPTTSRNLRRKRVMDTIFTKPVTRRRKL
ncbi:protein ELYS isoform X2 [Melanotaenia boesemani]|uniref:protein ELYS isoform X2 n=1 Tax=Melanotaenia boesemani TaxID=1250792 RepID=UPI001C048EA4|nr:protein ELYS isoform X2 [Melanotaenia boesemani]